MPIRAAVSARSFGALLTAFLEECRARGIGLGDRRRTERALHAFFEHLASRRVRRIEALAEADVVSFAHHVKTITNRFGRPASDHQQRVSLSAVKRFCAFLEQRQHVLANPAADVVLPKILRLPRFVLSEAEALRLILAPHPGTWTGKRDRALLELLYGTGIRGGECLRLDIGDVSLQGLQLFVRNGKGRKDRIVPIPLRAAAALDLYLREGRPEVKRSSIEPALFLSKYGRRLSTTRLSNLVAAHGQTARIKRHVHPHVLRHSCATHLLKGGADVRHVQALLGHRCIETTAIYTRVDITDLRQVLKRSHPRERRR